MATNVDVKKTYLNDGFIDTSRKGFSSRWGKAYARSGPFYFDLDWAINHLETIDDERVSNL
ncbi:MAG: hypothetical protein BroJett040_19180 [Oligoflexia bacterium]|nr:MAG: hypothetical protein BroJett040_19180 [Oligoflexia bacterium]